MIKKLFCFTIISTMIFSLGACKPKDAPVDDAVVTDIYAYIDADGNPVTSDNQASVTPDPSVTSKPLPSNYDNTKDKDFSKMKQVTFRIGWTNAALDMQKDDLGKYIENKFNCKFDTKIMPAEKIILLAAQDDLPDFFQLTLGSTTYMQLDREDQKFLYHIKRSAIDQYPLLKRYFNIHEYLNAFSNVSYDNQYVGLPFLNSSVKPTIGSPVSFYYRKDWAAKVNYDIPIDTVDKAYTLMKKFREEDPDKNGLKDTYGFSGGMWNIHYVPWVDTYSWVKENDPSSEFCGMYVPGYVNSRMFDCIKWWNRLLTEQIMPADFNLEQTMAGLIANKVGVSYGNSGDYWTWEFLVNRFDASHKDLYQTLPKINGRTQTVADVVSEFEVLRLNDSSPPKCPSQIENNITAINAKIKDDPDKLARIFDFYEWTITQEGANLSTYGILGKDYKIDSSGKVVRTLPASSTTPGAMKKLWEVYPSVQIFQLVSWGGSDPIPEKSSMYPEWVTERSKRVIIPKDKYAVISTIAVNNLMPPTKVKHLDAYDYHWFEDKLNRIIAQDGGKSIEQGWNEFKTEFFETKEGAQGVREVNALMKSQGLVGQE